MGFRITGGVVAKPQKVVVYGPEGIGKTTLAARFPSPLFIDTEGGSGHVDVRRLPEPTSWQMLMDEAAWVRDYPRECGGTLVLDTADWAEAMCTAHVCKKAGKTGVEDFGYGKGYVYVKEEFGKLLNLLSEVRDAGLNVLVTAHACIQKFEQPDEMGAYDRWELKLSRRHVAPMLKEWADALLFCNYKSVVVKDEDGKAHAQGGRNRMLYASHAATWDAKNRWGLPDEAPMAWETIAPHIPVPALSRAGVTPGEIEAARAMPVPFDGGEPLPGHMAPVADLMAADGITDKQLRCAMAARGYVPEDMPLANYDSELAGFIQGVWPQIRDFIRSQDAGGDE